MLLHGYGASKECFVRQINYFSRFYRVTAFDFPGFGASDPLPAAWDVGDYAAFTREKMEEWGLVRPYILAHSFGARVAVKMAASEDCAEKLVLTGAAGVGARRGAAYRFKVRAYRWTKKFFPAFAERHFGSAEYRTLSPLMKESYKKIVGEDLKETAKKIRVPALLVYGKKDDVTPVRAGKIYLSSIADSRLVVMKGCGHFAFIDDALSFNEITEEFLEN